MCQGQSITYEVPVCLVKLTPSVLVGAHSSFGLCWHLQPCRYVRDSDQLLEFHYKIMLRRWVPSCAHSRLGPLIGFLRPLFLRGCLVYPHRLRSCRRTRSDWTKKRPCFCVTRSSAMMCANDRGLISMKVDSAGWPERKNLATSKVSPSGSALHHSSFHPSHLDSPQEPEKDRVAPLRPIALWRSSQWRNHQKV